MLKPDTVRSVCKLGHLARGLRGWRMTSSTITVALPHSVISQKTQNGYGHVPPTGLLAGVCIKIWCPDHGEAGSLTGTDNTKHYHHDHLTDTTGQVLCTQRLINAYGIGVSMAE